MFFDEPKVDERFHQLLSLIAKKQRELLEYRFDWENRCPKPWPPKGFWGKDKKAIARYELAQQELEALKAETAAHRLRQGYPHGTFWWNIPWEQVENYLICDLTAFSEAGPWRWERKWKLVREEELWILLLDEEGHCSNFTGQYGYHYEELSRYSASERDQMVRDYNRKLDSREAWDLLLDNDRPVRSTYGNVFATRSDYMFSIDHYLDRRDFEESYRRSLYTEHHTNTLDVRSNSIHYSCTLAVAAFLWNLRGELDGVQVLDYALLGGRGQIPGDLEEEYSQKDAAVAFGAFVADNPKIPFVRAGLFGKGILDSAVSYAEAMRQAELYTCLAHKLRFDQ